MTAKKTFKINDYLTIKLESNSSVIYVKGKRFHQCKRLVLSVPLENMNSIEDLKSIDEIADTLEISPPVQETRLSPEEEFLGHCSNLQTWAEHEYDTRLLHSNLSFPLLRQLSNVGDPQAKKVFKEEIAKRLESGYFNTITYLIEQNYLQFLSSEELSYFLEDDRSPLLKTLNKALQSENIGYVINAIKFFSKCRGNPPLYLFFLGLGNTQQIVLIILRPHI